MVMEYQPIVDMTTGRPVAVEALVRWQHPRRGILTAGDFLDVVESSELVYDLGELSLRQACRDGAGLLAAGHRLTVHVNISPRHLERGGLVAQVEAELAASGFPAELLVLEVTETRLLNVSSSLVRELDELRTRGIRIAVDDFGTGYSSPAHLVQLPVDALKLDRSFVEGIEVRRTARAVSGGVLAMARGLGIETVAEGVESASQERALVAMGYQLAQGFLYSRAIPPTALDSWLRTAAA
jgi:EAL domain-containing protein (putative c-di-GMP-specific phosphodiesterase class I)